MAIAGWFTQPVQRPDHGQRRRRCFRPRRTTTEATAQSWRFKTRGPRDAPRPRESHAPRRSTPYDYGDYALSVGTAATDSVPLTTEQTASARYICYGWTLTNDLGASLGGDGTTQALFTVNTNVTSLGTGRTSGTSQRRSAARTAVSQPDMSGWYTNGVQVTVTATANVNYASCPGPDWACRWVTTWTTPSR